MTSSIDFSVLNGAPRLLIEADLKPIQGTRFQPTGFPDLGAATYTLYDGTEMLLVESAQSMANRFEEACWDRGSNTPAEELQGLPYVQVKIGNRFLTSSWLESHRLASAFIKDSIHPNGKTMVEFLREEFQLKKNKPLDWARIHRTILSLDPMCLIHGVFFADKKWPGQPKVPRALSAFIEAADVVRAQSGGVKKDDVSHKTGEGQKATEGYGHVPYPRVEFTAKRITAYSHLDLKQIHSYGLSAEATNLLTALAIFKVSKWLDSDMGLRTNCKFALVNGKSGVRIKEPENYNLPTLPALTEALKQLIQQNKSNFSSTPTTVTWSPKPASVELPSDLPSPPTIPSDLQEQCRVETKNARGGEKRVIVFEGPMDSGDVETLKVANPDEGKLHNIFEKLLEASQKIYGDEPEGEEETA
jgi:CRISPR-associated protein Csb1